MRWTFKKPPNLNTAQRLSEDLSIDITLSKLLVQRGVENFATAKKFFRPSLNDLHDPFLMKDMDLAVSRIETAIAKNENILIYGDYDVDGTTAVSLVSSYLKTLTSRIATYIPDRYEEGYGISFQGIDFAEDHNFSVIIALDCGIKALDKVLYASKKNIDFIICDHHKPGAEIPKAIAVLNPKRTDCRYPFDELCGCGVGFKLVQALASKRNQTLENLTQYLDLVATAIAADIVPIIGENRILAYYGLQVINTRPRNGIKAIISQINKKKLTITDVVFIIAPRINAAGRIKHGNAAVELLTEENFDLALEFSKKINDYNSKRRILDSQITKEALLYIEKNGEKEKYTTVVFDEKWHKGVIGIVASRLIETYYRPTLVFTKSGNKLAASARSVRGFDIYDALDQCSEYIEQFGGHKYAAGLTLDPTNYTAFKKKFEEVVKNSIEKKLLIPEIIIDLELELSDITPKFFRVLQQMGPFGPQNMKPIFSTNSVRDNGFGKKIGTDQSHLKLNIIYGADRKTYNTIGFGMGDKIKFIKNDFDIAYSLDENEWNGTTSIQLLLKDLKKSL